MSMPTLTHHRFSGGRLRTSPPRPYCCAAARNRRPQKSDEYARSSRCCSRPQQRSKRKALPRTSARSADELERHPPTARTHLLLSSRDTEAGSRPRHQRSRVVLDPTTTLGIPLKPDDKWRALTATTTNTRATTRTMGAADATTAMTTANAVGHQDSVDQGPLVRASVMRSSPRISRPRPMCQDTTGTPTPMYGLKITDLHATREERPTIFL
jgi:hypothetical protein